MSNILSSQVRQDYLAGGGIFGCFIYPYTEELKRSKFFLDTMEEFVEASEQREVAEHEQRIQRLTPAQTDEYWQWHYPIHWQEIFSNRIRASFVMQLCSFVEGELKEVADRVGVIAEAPIKLRDLNGTTLSKPKKFLEAFGRFQEPPKESWELVERIFEVRNVMVHEGGFAGGREHRKQLVDFAGQAPGLSLTNSHIEVKRAFCDYCLNVASEFCASLHQAYEAFRVTAQALEQMKGR